MQFSTDIRQDDHADPGVIIERRSILRSGSWLGWSMAMTLMGLSGKAAADEEQAIAGIAEQLEAHEFVYQVHKDALELIRSNTPDEELYLRSVSRLLDRVRSPTPWRMFEAGKGLQMDMSLYFPPVVMYQIRMEPGAIISLHDHRHYNGVLVVTEGDVRVRNFDLVDPQGNAIAVAATETDTPQKDVLIRETKDQRLMKKQSSTLTRDRDNIHQVEAGEKGCLLLDFFTHFRPEARSYELEWDATPFDAEKKIYKAAWKKD